MHEQFFSITISLPNNRNLLKYMLTLFTKPDCPLCDDAMDLLQMINDPEIKKININLHPEYQQYQSTIPVLKNNQTEKTLSWPFGLLDIEKLILDE